MASSLDIPDSESQAFALEVVLRLRDAGHEAVWAGGCVRDALLGIEPSDYDVATSARPKDVVRLFGERRSVSVGASFGVIVVLGKRKAQGQVEVAAFRSDGPYSDGRRPDSVTFCTAEEDARRRDFTINGMFYDPIADQVIDYIGGQRDLQDGVVRAIGNPEERFTEDKLRMLRAARFAARYAFELDEATAEAIRRQAGELGQVSVERVAQELRRMLGHPSRQTSIKLLRQTELLPVVFPMVADSALKTALQVFPFLRAGTFEPALATLFQDMLVTSKEAGPQRTVRIAEAARSFRLSNSETATVCWLCDEFDRCRSPAELPLHDLKPMFADHRHPLLLDRIQAEVRAGYRPDADLEFLQTWLPRTPASVRNPPPLISGADLVAMGLSPGPEFTRILQQVRDDQLDELICSPDDARRRAQELR